MIEDLPFDNSERAESDGFVPSITHSTTLFNKLGIKISKIITCDGKSVYFLNHWEITLPMPLLVNTIIISSMVVYFKVCLIYLERSKFFNYSLMFFGIMFIVSYFSIIREGPGFLPYYFPLKYTGKIAENDYLAGYATSRCKIIYAQTKLIRKQVSFFTSVRRFVLRPDHFCGWTGSFIGKKNHKFFFLFNFWGAIYCTDFTVNCIMALIDLMKAYLSDNKHLILCIIYTVLGIIFSLFTSSFVFSTIAETAENTTQFEKMRKRKSTKGKKSIREAFEEIFGSASKWYLWLLPVSAFGGESADELVKKME